MEEVAMIVTIAKPPSWRLQIVTTTAVEIAFTKAFD
jgi:hypothetical protein